MAESVSRDQILRRERGQGNINLPCSGDHEQDWQPYPVNPHSTICYDHRYIHTVYLFLSTFVHGAAAYCNKSLPRTFPHVKTPLPDYV